MPRDNGLAVNEETDMWNRILQDLRKAKEKNDKQKALSEQITALNEKIGKDGGSMFIESIPPPQYFYWRIYRPSTMKLDKNLTTQ